MAAEGTTSARPCCAAPAEPGLAALPLEILEAILGHLSLRDRVAAASCCRELWTRRDVASSEVLWGDLEAQPHLDELGAVPGLAAWLWRRRPAVRRVLVHGIGTGCGPAPQLQLLLHTLGHSAVQELGLHCMVSSPSDELPLEELQPAGALTQLELSSNNLLELPPTISCLSNLRSLVFSRTNFWDAPRLGALRHLSRLTRLSLRDDRLQSLPRALGHLTALVELDISRNSFCGPHDPLRALGLLPQLLALNLSLCHLHAVPAPLAHLSCLTALSLASNEGLGLCGDAVFEPLRHLSALRALDLSHCGLQRAPPQLSALVLLQDLDLSRNDDLADAGGEGGALSALGSLTGLTRLNLRQNGLWLLSPEAVASPLLAALDLCHNRLGWEEGALRALAICQALTCLTLGGNGLGSVPEQLSALSALEVLNLSHNELGATPAGAGGGQGGSCSGGGSHWDVLRALRSVTQVQLSDNGLVALPPALAAVTGLRELNVADNRLHSGGPGALRPLEGLPCLQRVVLGGVNHLSPRSAAVAVLPAGLRHLEFV